MNRPPRPKESVNPCYLRRPGRDTGWWGRCAHRPRGRSDVAKCRKMSVQKKILDRRRGGFVGRAECPRMSRIVPPDKDVNPPTPLEAAMSDLTRAPGIAGRQAGRSGRLTGPTPGLALGYVRANLVILPREHAFDFLLFCQRNPNPCPLLDVTGDVRAKLPTAALERDEARAAVARLAATNGSEAYQQTARLAGSATSAVAALREGLRPVTAPDANAVAGLIRDLDNPQFAVREKAAGRLRRRLRGVTPQGPGWEALGGGPGAGREATGRVDAARSARPPGPGAGGPGTDRE